MRRVALRALVQARVPPTQSYSYTIVGWGKASLLRDPATRSRGLTLLRTLWYRLTRPLSLL